MHYFSGISDGHVVNNVTSMHETQFQMSFLNICLQKCFTLYGNDFQKSKQFNFILSPRFTEKRGVDGLMAPPQDRLSSNCVGKLLPTGDPSFGQQFHQEPFSFVIPVCFFQNFSSIRPRQWQSCGKIITSTAKVDIPLGRGCTQETPRTSSPKKYAYSNIGTHYLLLKEEQKMRKVFLV